MNLGEAVLMAADALEASLEDAFKGPTECMLVRHHVRFLRTLVKMAGEDKLPETPVPSSDAGDSREGRLVKVLTGSSLATPGKSVPTLVKPGDSREGDPWEEAFRRGEADRVKRLVERQESAAREELKARVSQEESGSGMAEAVGGPLDETFVPIDPRMPVGAKTVIDSAVYALHADRKLHYSKAETESLLAKKSRVVGGG